jgi:hypothetical protein
MVFGLPHHALFNYLPTVGRLPVVCGIPCHLPVSAACF